LRHTDGRAPLWLRVVAFAGFATTALYIVLSTLPIVTVESRLAFAVKISAVVIGTNVVGVLLYRRRRPLSS
jgi:hypothetical protein